MTMVIGIHYACYTLVICSRNFCLSMCVPYSFGKFVHKYLCDLSIEQGAIQAQAECT